MSQNDMTIANQGFPATRTDINSALQALASTSSGATEPSTMFANQLWFDTAANKLKIRNEANSAWYDIVEVNESTGALNINSATIGATTAAAGAFTTLSATGVTTVQAGTAALPAITTTGDTNTGIFFPAADTIAFAEGGAEAMRINSSGQIETTAGTAALPAITTTGDTNTGIFFPAADTIAFTEGGTEVMRLDSSANLQFNSGYGSVATAYGCRAWVNFNGTGTVAIRGSGNVSSITDRSTGLYTVNFTTAMPDANYSAVGIGSDTSTDYGAYLVGQTRLAGSFNIFTSSYNSLQDSSIVSLAVFR